MSLIEIILLFSAFLVMEPVTALAHRLIFHGFGYGIHKSHHSPREGPFEKNDFYPLISACITMTIIALGVFHSSFWYLIPVGFGMTLYGVAYFMIHDVAIHRRIKGIEIPPSWYRWHYRAHVFHHAFGAEPYGFVIPVVPKRYRNVSLEAIDDPLKPQSSY